tara:strand:+ start:276 stop:989 length:714 start_codon:yes stop_codon:yes gene_type:complete
MKKLLINGCSFGQVWVPDDKFSQEIGCDTVVNISRPGTGFQRTVRTTIEWVAQNGNPSMVIIPITFSHRWEMPIHDSEKFDNLDGIWMPLQTNSAMDNDISNEKIVLNDRNDKQKIKQLNDLYFGLISNTVGYWDKLFTEIISLSAFLEQRGIPYLMFDICNDFDETLLIDHSFVQKAKLIKNNKKIIDIFSFCGNKYMWRFLQLDNSTSFNQHHKPIAYRGLESYILQYIKDNHIL